MKAKALDNYIIYNEETQTYEMDREQAVRDDVEKHRVMHMLKTILKDWRLYLMLIPMILVFLFWRYFPMYELLGCFKLTEVGVDVADQHYIGYY